MYAVKQYDWLDISDEQKSRVVAELEDWYKAEILNLATVIKGQHESLADNGFWDIWCLESDDHCEVSNGKESLEEFAARCFELGWSVENLERNKAICSACLNAPNKSTWASQFEDNRGLLG